VDEPVAHRDTPSTYLISSIMSRLERVGRRGGVSPVGKPEPGLPSQLTGQAAKVAASLGAAGELVADKLPSAPSRLEPAGLGGRTVLAAVAAAVLARGAKDPLLPTVVVAAAAALLSARIGHDVRAAASKRMPPAAAATAEDMVALGLAAASARS